MADQIAFKLKSVIRSLYVSALFSGVLSLVILPAQVLAGTLPELAVSTPSGQLLAMDRYKISLKLSLNDTSLQDDQVLDVSLSSSSDSGLFFEGETASESIELVSATVNRLITGLDIYYKDTSIGLKTLNFSISAAGLSGPIEASGEVDIKGSPDILLQLAPFADTHTNLDPIVAMGSIKNLPEDSSVRAILLNSDGVEKVRLDVDSRGDNIELFKMPLPSDLKSGNYTVRLELFKPGLNPEVVLRTVNQSVQVKLGPSVDNPVVSPTPEPVEPPHEPEPAPALVDSVKYEELKIELPPLSTLATVKNPAAGAVKVLGSNSGVYATGVAGAAIAAEPSGKASSPADSNSPDDKSVTEQSIKLKSGNKNSVAIQPSKQGWQIFGAPWYWWGIGGASMYGVWIGARRFLQREV
ncbi:hypothetical protein GX865_03570 [Candidatus Saccharibacteria bacterium]|jgi:hypothetical protein|nr:hypothetical protein [Candidatus Saccharibacteria bacterium]